MAITTLKGKIPDAIRDEMRGYLSRDRVLIPQICQRAGCNVDTAIDVIEHWVNKGICHVLKMPDGAWMINFLLNEQQITEVIVDTECKLIMKGKTNLERDFDKAKGVVGRTLIEMPKPERLN